MKLIIVFLAISIFSVSCTLLNEYLELRDDNIMEEVIEGGIKIKTGLDIDLTPESVETYII